MGLTLLIVGLLVTVVALVAMVIKATKEKGLKKKYPKHGIAVLVGGVLAFSGIYMLENESVLSGPNGDIVATINKVAGKKAKDSGGKKRVVNVSVVDDVITGGGAKLVNVTLNADEFSWAGRTRDVIFDYSSKLLPVLFNDPSVSELTLNWNLPLIDERGNTNDRTVVTIAFTKGNASTVNWNSFIIHNFPIVADRYYEHAIFK